MLALSCIVLKPAPVNAENRLSEAILATTRDGQFVAVRQSLKVIHIFNTNQLDAPSQTLHLDTPFRSVAFSPKGKWLAIGSTDHDLSVYRCQPTCAKQPEWQGQIGGPLSGSLGLSIDHIAWIEGRRLHIRDIETGKDICQARLPKSSSLAEIHPIQGTVIIQRNVRLDWHDPNQCGVSQFNKAGSFPRYDVDGRKVLLSGLGHLKLLEAEDLTPLITIPLPSPRHVAVKPRFLGSDMIMSPVAWAGRLDAKLSQTLQSRIWKISDDRATELKNIAFRGADVLIQDPLRVLKWVNGVWLSEPVNTIDTPKNSHFIQPNQGHVGPVMSTAWSPDGKYLLSSSDSELILWDIGSQKKLRSFGLEGEAQIGFIPDSTYIYAVESLRIRIWDSTDGNLIRWLGINDLNQIINPTYIVGFGNHRGDVSAGLEKGSLDFKIYAFPKDPQAPSYNIYRARYSLETGQAVPTEWLGPYTNDQQAIPHLSAYSQPFDHSTPRFIYTHYKRVFHHWQKEPRFELDHYPRAPDPRRPRTLYFDEFLSLSPQGSYLVNVRQRFDQKAHPITYWALNQDQIPTARNLEIPGSDHNTTCQASAWKNDDTFLCTLLIDYQTQYLFEMDLKNGSLKSQTISRPSPRTTKDKDTDIQPQTMAFHPQTKMLAIGYTDGNLILINPALPETHLALGASESEVESLGAPLGFSSDGAILFARQVKTKSTLPVSIRSHEMEVTQLSFDQTPQWKSLHLEASDPGYHHGYSNRYAFLWGLDHGKGRVLKADEKRVKTSNFEDVHVGWRVQQFDPLDTSLSGTLDLVLPKQWHNPYHRYQLHSLESSKDKELNLLYGVVSQSAHPTSSTYFVVWSKSDGKALWYKAMATIDGQSGFQGLGRGQFVVHPTRAQVAFVEGSASSQQHSPKPNKDANLHVLNLQTGESIAEVPIPLALKIEQMFLIYDAPPLLSYNKAGTHLLISNWSRTGNSSQIIAVDIDSSSVVSQTIQEEVLTVCPTSTGDSWTLIGTHLRETIGKDGAVLSHAYSPQSLTEAHCLDQGIMAFDAKSTTHFIVDTDNPSRQLSFQAHQSYGVTFWDENGYFWGPAEGLRELVMVSELGSLPVTQAPRRLYRPDKILESFPEANAESITQVANLAKSRAQRLKQQPFCHGRELPRFGLSTHDLNIIQERSRVSVVLSLEDTDCQLSSWSLSVDGSPILSGNAEDFNDTSSIEREIELVPGANQLRLVWRDLNGATSLPSTLRFYHHSLVNEPSLYILAVGVNTYESSEFDLNYALQDAEDMSQILASLGRESFSNVYTRILKPEATTRQGILEAADFFKATKANDQAIIFLAGHGLLERDDYFFAPRNMNFDVPSQQGIKYEELFNLFAQGESRNNLMLVDSCHSGPISGSQPLTVASSTDGTAIVSRGPPMIAQASSGALNPEAQGSQLSSSLQFLAESSSSGITVLAAAAGEELALESDAWRNGLFTHSLRLASSLDFERDGFVWRADTNRDGQLTLSEVLKQTRSTASELSKGRQRPSLRAQNFERDILLRRSQRPAATITLPEACTRLRKHSSAHIDPSGNYFAKYGHDNGSCIYDLTQEKLVFESTQPSTIQLAGTDDWFIFSEEHQPVNLIQIGTDKTIILETLIAGSSPCDILPTESEDVFGITCSSEGNDDKIVFVSATQGKVIDHLIRPKYPNFWYPSNRLLDLNRQHLASGDWLDSERPPAKRSVSLYNSQGDKLDGEHLNQCVSMDLSRQQCLTVLPRDANSEGLNLSILDLETGKVLKKWDIPFQPFDYQIDFQTNQLALVTRDSIGVTNVDGHWEILLTGETWPQKNLNGHTDDLPAHRILRFQPVHGQLWAASPDRLMRWDF